MRKQIAALRAALDEQGLDAYYVSNAYNLRYITGFTGVEAWAVITRERAYLVTDFRYTEQAQLESPDLELVLFGRDQAYQTPGEFLKAVVAHDHIERLGYEDEDVTVAAYRELADQVEATLVPASGLIEALRRTKYPEEIANIRRACMITDEAFSHIVDYIEPGMTELQIANELDFTMRRLGASGTSFETIVASGARSAMPHGTASGKQVKTGELITIDFGCYYQGYTSDMTRTLAIGAVDARLKKIYQIVYDANRLVREQAKPGLTGRELEVIARDYIDAHGYGAAFGHSLGHGIGLEIHEAPAANLHSADVMQENQLITDEPGIYLTGLGGVRIEDDLLFTRDGVEVLTQAPRELITL